MNLDFLQQAKQQPDLEDAVAYLEEPLIVLGNVMEKYGQDTTTEEYRRCLRIVQYHLPKLFGNYCEFSLKYRNTYPIKKLIKNGHTTNYTAKDILLQDLAKIIEEIHILERQLNENNKINFLAHNRLIAQLEAEPQTELPNTFNYSKAFTKEDVEKKSSNPKSSGLTPTYLSWWLVLCLCMGVYMTTPKAPVVDSATKYPLTYVVIEKNDSSIIAQNTITTQQEQHAITAIEHLSASTKSFAVVKKGLPADLSLDLLNTNGYIPQGSPINSSPFPLSVGTNLLMPESYHISMTRVPSTNCSIVVKHLFYNFSQASVNGHSILTQDLLRNPQIIKQSCSLPENSITMTNNIDKL